MSEFARLIVRRAIQEDLTPGADQWFIDLSRELGEAKNLLDTLIQSTGDVWGQLKNWDFDKAKFIDQMATLYSEFGEFFPQLVKVLESASARVENMGRTLAGSSTVTPYRSSPPSDWKFDLKAAIADGLERFTGVLVRDSLELIKNAMKRGEHADFIEDDVLNLIAEAVGDYGGIPPGGPPIGSGPEAEKLYMKNKRGF